MGNSEPLNSKLKVYIETEKPFYNSGSILNSVVFVEANDYFDFDALYIRVEGDEFCEWFQGSSKNRRKFVGDENFYTQEHMLSKYSEGVTQGKYIYPFSMELSQNIPGSFQSPIYEAKIRYKLVAYFTNFTDPYKRHRYQTPLIIREPFRQQMAEYEGKITTYPRSLLCFSQGQITLQAHFMRNVCFEGESVPISVACDNSMGKANIKRIIVNLVQYIFVSANNGADRTYRKIIDTQYINTRIPKRTKAQNLQINFQIKSKKILAQTAISTLVANYYRLEVYADIGSVTSHQPCIFCPLFVMKKVYQHAKNPKWARGINEKDYKSQKIIQFFHAPDYWFRKNRNLDVVNFRLEDNIVSQMGNYL